MRLHLNTFIATVGIVAMFTANVHIITQALIALTTP